MLKNLIAIYKLSRVRPVLFTPAFQSYYSAGDEAEPYCPTCDRDLRDVDYCNYCPDCGQALEWEDYPHRPRLLTRIRFKLMGKKKTHFGDREFYL